MSDRLAEHMAAWRTYEYDRSSEQLRQETAYGSYFDIPGRRDARILACELLALEAESE